MNRLVIPLLIVVVLAPVVLPAAEADFPRLFQDKDGCFELYDLKTGRVVQRYNEKRCALRVAPCSTFKVPLALMVFDQGILADEKTTYKWDGVDRGRPTVNRDTTAADWVKYSVVWYSQRLTPQLGTKKIKDYLASFDYGNRDISSGLTNFWLGRSLKISADEQLRFWERFWTNGLPVSRHAAEVTRKITYLETSPSGMKLSGKTGSHITDRDELGWFVGHLEGPKGEYLVVLNYSGPPSPKDTYPGMVAQDNCKKILGRLGFY
jgi:beta-lactamase class D